jgi:hypothetical protein
MCNLWLPKSYISIEVLLIMNESILFLHKMFTFTQQGVYCSLLPEKKSLRFGI